MNRTYVCSDLHSHLDVLEEALAAMDETDRLYFIGDAIDKGPDGLLPLKKIMNDKRCTMLMGNHDLMFLQYLACTSNKETPEAETEDIEVSWLFLNFGFQTIAAYEECSEEEKQEIFEYLKNLPLVINLEVNGRKFLLVHAALPYKYNDVEGTMYTEEIKDPEHDWLYQWKSDFVWGRYETRIEGKTVITGHSIVQMKGVNTIIDKGDWIDIDCGLAMRNELSSLAVVCLDDMSVKYYKPKVF